MRLDISASELEYLTALLQRDAYLLEHEISRTDHRDFKQILRDREHLCEQLLDKVVRQTAHSTA